MRLERILLLAGVAVPILYFGNLLVSPLFYPGYSHVIGVGSLVTRANVGIFQRLYALSSFPWIGVASYVLARELGTSASGGFE